ncbi:thiamine-phosphate kinase [Candidatus Margulisiibacteriota bacterium]
MKLSQLGEFGLIDQLTKLLGVSRKGARLGIGDDAAAIELKTKGSLLLITTDTLIENVHFKLKTTSFTDLGNKALAINISDVAAMGGVPAYALVTIGASKTVPVKNIRQIYKGVDKLARRHGIEVIGGDTVSSRDLIVSITLLGEVEKKYLLTRAGAKPGDLILVTGDFGGPAAAGYDSRKWKVESRTQEARMIAKSQIATAMIDSSDGLARSVLEICKASRVGAVIYEKEIPLARGANVQQGLHGGEEYELVFTAPAEAVKKIKKLLGKTPLSIVGDILLRKKGVNVLDLTGRVKALKNGGYEHFK